MLNAFPVEWEGTQLASDFSVKYGLLWLRKCHYSDGYPLTFRSPMIDGFASGALYRRKGCVIYLADSVLIAGSVQHCRRSDCQSICGPMRIRVLSSMNLFFFNFLQASTKSLTIVQISVFVEPTDNL